MKTKHTSENKKFDATLPKNLCDQWRTMIRNWESNKSNPNPYTHAEKGISSVPYYSTYTHVYLATNLAEVRRKLAKADEEEIARGAISHPVPGWVFIRDGLDIEEQQLVHSNICMLVGTHYVVCYRRQLVSAIKKKALKTDNQIASVQERRNSIMREIKKWREVQLVYMPGVVTTPFQASEDNGEDNDVERAENVPLLLPSSLDSESRERICLHRVAEHEQLLRLAQIKDSLIDLQHTRKIRRTMLVDHRIQVAGQGQRVNTRSRATVNRVDTRINKIVERYRAAYRALLQFDPTGNWREKFLELKDSDNRGPGKESEEEGVGDGSYFRSWIWLANPRNPDIVDGETAEEGASEEEVNEMLRVEWTTSFARLERWSEEVELLQEEMRRVVAFLEWKSGDWLAKVDARGGEPASDIQSGLRAYAKKQAAIFHNLAISFTKLWYPTLVSYDLRHSWMTEFMKEHNIPLPDLKNLDGPARGIFKYRILDAFPSASSTAAPGSLAVDTPNHLPTNLPAVDVAARPHLSLNSPAVDTPADDHPPLKSPVVAATTSKLPPEEASDSGESDFDDGKFDSDWDDDLDF